jgi:hypothetical protein
MRTLYLGQEYQTALEESILTWQTRFEFMALKIELSCQDQALANLRSRLVDLAIREREDPDLAEKFKPGRYFVVCYDHWPATRPSSSLCYHSSEFLTSLSRTLLGN